MAGTEFASQTADRVEYCGEMLTPQEAASAAAVGHATPTIAATTFDAFPADVPYREGVYGLARQGSRTRTNCHLGQRKLLIGEVEFLSEVGRPGATVVYAGAAAGIHIPFLASLFPGVGFELYDPGQFRLPRCAPDVHSRLHVHRQLFTDDTARACAEAFDDVLFISDIRTGSNDAAEASEQMGVRVPVDMEMQQRWVDIIRPRAAMLKFRLPYDAPADLRVEYLAGELRTQAWGPHSSTEGRLIVRRPAVGDPPASDFAAVPSHPGEPGPQPASGAPYPRVQYGARDHENRAFYLSAIEREWAFYDHGIPVTAVPGLDHCYDCAREVGVWRKYAAAARRRPPPSGPLTETEKLEVSALMAAVGASQGGQTLDRPPHGLRPNERMFEKRETLGVYFADN